MSDARVIGVFEVPADMDYYTPGSYPRNSDIRWLLRNMTSRADKELGIERVDVAVKASPDGTVFDVTLNDKSIGYFALRNFVSTLDTLKLPKLITHGPEQYVDVAKLCEDYDYGVYIIPLFGELFDES